MVVGTGSLVFGDDGDDSLNWVALYSAIFSLEVGLDKIDVPALATVSGPEDLSFFEMPFGQQVAFVNEPVRFDFHDATGVVTVDDFIF